MQYRMAMVKASDIRREAKKIVDDLFLDVLQYGSLDDCQRAAEFLQQKIHGLEVKARQESIKDSEDASRALIEGYHWKAARRHFCKLYGQRKQRERRRADEAHSNDPETKSCVK